MKRNNTLAHYTCAYINNETQYKVKEPVRISNSDRTDIMQTKLLMINIQYLKMNLEGVNV
jgi:hypothetical protein